MAATADFHLGYNYQFGRGRGIVLGVEGGFQPTHAEVDRLVVVGDDATHTGVTINRLGTIVLRAGYAYDRFFAYGLGGLAIADERLSRNSSVDDLTFDGAPVYTASNSQSSVRLGYAVGGGVAYALSERLSVRLEGLRYDLGTATIGTSAKPASGTGLPRIGLQSTAVRADGVIVRTGIDYRFADIGVTRSSFPSRLDDDRAPQSWAVMAGLRYFYSSGSFRYRLSAPGNETKLNSALTYSGLAAHAAESFMRVDHVPTGFFLKGYLGAGAVVSGHLQDEDFPPGVSPYSNTISSVKNGDITYVDADIGKNVLVGSNYTIGGFVGFHHLSETENSYGCAQTTVNKSICTPTIAASSIGLSEDAEWNAFRVGVNGQLRVDRFKLDVDAAYLPEVALSGYDHHWLRPDINALPQHGLGNGFQLEADLSYDVTDWLAVGIGTRFWSMSANGNTQFPLVAPSPVHYAAERLGGFAQVSYKFDR